MTVNVALSMLTVVPGGMGGSETYARELTRQLVAEPRVQATAVLPVTASGFGQGLPETVIRQVRGGPSTADRLRAVLSAQMHARQIWREVGPADVIHFPFTVPAPRPARGIPWVQSLLDVQHLELPHLFGRAELAYRRRFYEGPARSASAVITISHFAKARMIELLGLPAEKIHVAQLGVDAEQYSPNLGERQDFVLYPARGWQHKNHNRLIEAMSTVREARPGMRLVLTGGGLDTLGPVPDWVDIRGLVDADELKTLYRTAAALAFPSLYEGFGLPPLEAMASGCPVAASSAGSIPEVCGDAAVLFDPMDAGSIARGILTAIDRTVELSAAGLDQVGKFTWERCRDVHVEVYEALA